MSENTKRFLVRLLLDQSMSSNGVLWSSHFDTADDAMRASNSALAAERNEAVRETIEQEVIDAETNDRWVRIGTGSWEKQPS